ncbi:hypothetical protein [Pseudomonas sp. CGJS7]|uniref:hypothetical protein n=1 Tax=Pseudomonas sp. CGJS7 TaxID=3109348 RepID=UPI0030087422
MPGEYDRLRRLLLQSESSQLEELRESLRRTRALLGEVPEIVAEHLETSQGQGRPSRLTEALTQSAITSLEMAVRQQPQVVTDALYAIVGPTIRRSLGETMREMADDLDRTLRNTLSLRTLRWRLQAWRSGLPYAQVVLRNTMRYRVEYLYLIEPQGGLLLGHCATEGLQELDSDAIAGMFTAINQFVMDSVPMDRIGGIGSATVGEYRLVVSDGPLARLVAFVRGVPSSDFRNQLNQLNEKLHSRHASALSADSSADMPNTELLEQSDFDHLNRSLAEEHTASRRRRPYLRWTLAISLAALATHVGFSIHWALLARDIEAHFAQTPGMMISYWDDSRRGRLRGEGLIDPLADDPKRWLAERYPDVKLDWRARPYMSLEPAILERRAARRLGIPLDMAEYLDGTISLKGTLRFADWYRVTQTSMSIPGVDRVDTAGLDYPGAQRVRELIVELEGMQVRFDSGTTVPIEGMQAQIDAMVDRVDRLQALGKAEGMAFRLRAKGFTDEVGSYSQNRSLRQARAEWLAARLDAALSPPSTVIVDTDETSSIADIRATCVVVVPYPVAP